MTQYDAGPGDLSDRPWEDPEKKPKPHARRRRVSLPPWALLAILVGLVIVLCVGLVLLVRALRGSGDGEQAAPAATVTVTDAAGPTATVSLITPTSAVTPTDTVVLPVSTPEVTPPVTEIGPGALVVVQGTGGGGLNLREQPTTYAKKVGSVRDGTVLPVLAGPREADDYVWWSVRAPDGTEGWAAGKWLILKPEE